jgi:hypothetical protein
VVSVFASAFAAGGSPSPSPSLSPPALSASASASFVKQPGVIGNVNVKTAAEWVDLNALNDPFE